MKKIKYGLSNNFNKTLRRAGWNWWSVFRKRNPDIVLRQPENLSRNRALVMEEERIRRYFRHLEHLLEAKGLKNEPSKIFNVDEINCYGVQSVTQGGKVLAKKATECANFGYCRKRIEYDHYCMLQTRVVTSYHQWLFSKDCESRVKTLLDSYHLLVLWWRYLNPSGLIDLFLAWFKHFISHPGML